MMNRLKGASFRLVPFFIICQLVSLSVLAEVPVVEIEDRQAVTPVNAPPPATTISTVPQTTHLRQTQSTAATSRQDQLSDIFSQMQKLQREVQELRGVVEQQGFELQTLKQQNKDNYIDLDARIAALQASGSATTTSATTSAPASTLTPGANAGAEKNSYDAAYKLLEKNRKEEAVAAFQRHVAQYPEGEYAGNARYWLGQIYLTQNQLDDAREQLLHLLKNYPDHRKIPDAKFALGKVYFQQGKKTEAKKLIQEVAQGKTKTAELARTYLQANF